ncbi:MAG: DNA-3-methyladenine glycosylase I [Desulfobacteraceae bacterium]|nr:MAG: DNA-3-methyladenine glycosylase I [Desulfobacteraceae bacterium]
MKKRCSWAGSDPLYIDYHDREWGVQVHDDRKLFEFLLLEGAQAGLSWITILKKRDSYRKAFDSFDPEKISFYGPAEIGLLLENQGIVKNRMKIESAIMNAKSFLAVKKEYGSFDSYVWKFTYGKQIRNSWTETSRIPSLTEESVAMSLDMKQRGFKFVGPTICYSFMQAVGMVNDHTVDCFRYNQV